jgi:hypothetical protein
MYKSPNSRVKITIIFFRLKKIFFKNNYFLIYIYFVFVFSYLFVRFYLFIFFFSPYFLMFYFYFSFLFRIPKFIVIFQIVPILRRNLKGKTRKIGELRKEPKKQKLNNSHFKKKFYPKIFSQNYRLLFPFLSQSSTFEVRIRTPPTSVL